MSLAPETLKTLVKAAAEQVIANAAELTALDQAIGDGDHGANMKRGFEAVLGKLDAIAALPPAEAFKTIGKTLVMTVGGASGPLYGSFFLAAGDALATKDLPADLADVFGSGVKAVSSRGCAPPPAKPRRGRRRCAPPKAGLRIWASAASVMSIRARGQAAFFSMQ